MANVAKFGKAAVGHLAKHFERAQDENGEYVKFGNQNIDLERTPGNYNLAPERDISQGEFIKQRCTEVKCLQRKDVNVMCSWVLTAPKEIAGSQDEPKFFQEAYSFLEEKYGKDNVVSAYVHKDEVTPHMHFAFVPVVADKKTGKPKVSAKECLTKLHLKTFHNELSQHMEQAFGRDIGILNEATRDGNKSIEELKRGTAVKQLEEIRENVTKTQNELSGLQKRVLDTSEAQKLREKAKKGFFGGLRGVSYRDFENLQMTAANVDETEQRAAAADRRADIAEQKAAEAKNETLQAFAKIQQEWHKLGDERAAVEAAMEKTPSKMLQAENARLAAKNKKLSQALDGLKKFVLRVADRLPEELRPEAKKLTREALDAQLGKDRSSERGGHDR